jgi:hypothetical protein
LTTWGVVVQFGQRQATGGITVGPLACVRALETICGRNSSRSESVAQQDDPVRNRS